MKGAKLGIAPFEGGCQDVADVGQVQEKEGHPYEGVDHREDLSPQRGWRNVAIA